MSPAIPPHLSALMEAETAQERDAAWARFVEKYSTLLIHAARNGTGSHDETMDRYTFVLEKLQADEFHRLRAFSPHGKARFSTWLHVVARRLGVDYHRRRFGRPTADGSDRGNATSGGEPPPQATRYRLARLISEELDVDGLPDEDAEGPEAELIRREISTALSEALQELAPRERLLLTLRYEEDLPVREIYRIMSFRSPFQVYRRLKKARGELRRKLEERGVTRP